ncbi:hypothetical protein HHK36_000794 [Tetracentron sinense]|uniref:Tobamovirus multiplication protein 2A n=1 Tax=Tetracentron sinense TaxID=13715 RepID=A0A834ZX06_TETSI|nr:hypothetical protein HHK36_000794 [Tetracentron sinense]
MYAYACIVIFILVLWRPPKLILLFIYLFIAVGVIILVVSCFGCIGAVTRNGCCLSCVSWFRMYLFSFCININKRYYSVLVILLILAELGCAAFIFFDHSWKDAIPSDKTGDFEMIYSFLKENWKITKWVALGAVILEALVFFLALIVRAANRPADYDSDDEYIASRQGIRQPLINKQGVPAAGAPVTGTLDQRPNRNDAWSTRMREKVRIFLAPIYYVLFFLFSIAYNQYGLETSEFTYNPSESNRLPQAASQPGEERSHCTIL